VVSLNEHQEGPWILVFSQSYHPLWQLKVGESIVPEERHFQVNGYANAWLIKDLNPGSLTIEYSRQRLFYLGGLISLVSLVSSLFLLKFKRK